MVKESLVRFLIPRLRISEQFVLLDSDLARRHARNRWKPSHPRAVLYLYLHAIDRLYVRVWISRALPPGATHGTETEEVSDVVGQDAVGDDPQRPFIEASPVPRSGHQIQIRMLCHTGGGGGEAGRGLPYPKRGEWGRGWRSAK